MISIFIAGFLSLPARAQTPLIVKVDSFNSTGRATTAAELCGHIEGGVKTSQQILIVTDPKSSGPGKYVALTTPQGEFCSVVATVTGLADVTILGASSSPLTATLETKEKQNLE